VTQPPDDRMGELQQLFFESADELVQKLNDEALRLEKTPGDAETARSLRRTVHTLKGDSAACGFRELSELCHEFEDVLTLGSTAAAPLIPEIALRAVDGFAALLDAYRTGAKPPNMQSLRADIARLAQASSDGKGKTKSKKGKTAAKSVRWSEYEQLAIAQAIENGRKVQHVTVQLDPQCAMPIAGRQMIQLALSGLGEILAVYPPEGSVETTGDIEAALASNNSAEQIRAKCSIPTISAQVKVKAIREASAPVAKAAAPVAPADNAETLVPMESAGHMDAHEQVAAASENTPLAAASTGPDNLLRVDAEKIDSVLNLVGELILAKSMLQQNLLEFGARFPKDPLRGKFADAMAFQGRVLNDLQHSVMKIRMVPVDHLFRRFPRVVRDVGRQTGKDVELVVRGGQTDLDKSILDAIAEPLTHLVRNAIGHGIESCEERARAGKPARGTLRLAAYHQGNQVVIEVSDDGRGVDAEKVLQRALSQGLLTPGEAASLTESETLELILQPGFSTAEEITELSGRGVGLDVVQSVVTRLKGTVQIETALGKGTTFRLRLPLTLAIIRALLFRVEERLYALPLNAVAEIARTTEQEIDQVERYEVLQLRNEVLPLLRLGQQPIQTPEAARNKVFVLVISSGERKFGVIVDALEGEDELVIKALDDRSITTDLVSGASILGDGRVVLILNLIALTERFTKRRNESAGARMAGLLSEIGRSVHAINTSASNAVAGGHS
jgi:two-component system, chemotaxis family, sensor kinase CheA